MSAMLSDCSSGRDNNFNLLRMVAAALVLYSHSFVLSTGSPAAEPLSDILGITWGIVAVDVFFVTSGFLVTGSLFRRKSIVAFIWARVLRIYPALFFSIIFSAFVVGLLFSSFSPLDYLVSPQLYAFLARNTTVMFGVEYSLPGVFSSNPYENVVNGSLWTLPYEILMYAILASIGCLLLLWRKCSENGDIKWAFLALAFTGLVLSLVSYLFKLELLNSHYIFFHLFFMFFAGAALFVWRSRVLISMVVCVVMVVVLMLCATDQNVFAVFYTLFLPYLVVCLAYIPSGFVRNYNKLGDYSYGMYIYAFPVQQSLAALIVGVDVVLMAILSLVVTLMLAIISWHMIELRFLSMKENYIEIELFLLALFRRCSALFKG